MPSARPPFAAAGAEGAGPPTAPAVGAPVREALRVNPRTGFVASPILDDPSAAAMFESLILGGYSPEEAIQLLQAMADGQLPQQVGQSPFTSG
ncbi:MAG: hypothetical protein CTY20_00685 [Hyphomicrobium sp.]|nr:MAG: hypothetical protein CTY20_00685 [Hyphomicrobium sp.]